MSLGGGPVRILFIFTLAMLLPASPALAENPAREARSAFLDAWSQPTAGQSPTRRREIAELLLESAKRLLDAEGIVWREIVFEGRPAIEIVPGEQSLQNRQAARLHARFQGLRLVYDPAALTEAHAFHWTGPVADQRNHAILLPHEAIATQRPTVAVWHELFHAIQEVRLGFMKDSVFHGYVERPDGNNLSFFTGGRHSLYQKHFVIEEAAAAAIDMHHAARQLAELLQDDVHPQTIRVELEHIEHRRNAAAFFATNVRAMVRSALEMNVSRYEFVEPPFASSLTVNQVWVRIMVGGDRLAIPLTGWRAWELFETMRDPSTSRVRQREARAQLYRLAQDKLRAMDGAMTELLTAVAAVPLDAFGAHFAALTETGTSRAATARRNEAWRLLRELITASSRPREVVRRHAERATPIPRLRWCDWAMARMGAFRAQPAFTIVTP